MHLSQGPPAARPLAVCIAWKTRIIELHASKYSRSAGTASMVIILVDVLGSWKYTGSAVHH